MDTQSLAAYRKGLVDLFSGYRAEWLDERIFELFTEPSYFPQLTTSHPCFLEGGRGTGKTTTLRCLSYQGQAALRNASETAISDWSYFGMYYRINTNRVRAFSGNELNSSGWINMFAHYVNLEFSELIVEFLEWYTRENEGAPSLTVGALQSVAITLHLDNVTCLRNLRDQLHLSKLKFEAAINNIAAGANKPQLSMQGVPIDALMCEIKRLPQFQNKSFFFLIDEYENLDDSQQRVFNTLIKHCGELYSFKVGVRELGFRERLTLNDTEQLTHPADYRLINITQELDGRFVDFASSVCEQRLNQVFGSSLNLSTLLPELSPEQEADKLGVRSAVESTIQQLQDQKNDEISFRNWLSRSTSLEIYALSLRAGFEEKSVAEKLQHVIDEPEKWKEHYENYKQPYLFRIRRGKRGIRKYFSGWRVFCLLAASNIRYLLELVDQALNKHIDSGHGLEQPVDPVVQTEVAQITGQRNLRELEGLSLNGAKLTRLLLSLGRIFQVMAEDPIGHTPEVTQFYLNVDINDSALRDRTEDLLTDGIMHLALLRYPGSKLQQQTNVRQFDYMIHPIFSAFFGYSYRRKRKIELSDQDILNLVDQPSIAIKEILERQNRTLDIDLPEQMELFGGFYGTL